MLLSSYRLLLEDPIAFLRLTVLVAFSLVVAITVHEFSHALIASGLGDSTARRLGRLTLNPVRHLDPSGTVMLLVAGFGWGKPVPVDQHRLRNGRLGMAVVAGAGPLSNIVAAFLLAIPFKLGILLWDSPGLGQVQYLMNGGLEAGLSDLLGFVIFFNLLLAVFNLIPLYPLDGAKVLVGLLPPDLAARYSRVERFGPMLLVALVLADYALGLGLLWRIIGPIVGGLESVAIGY